MQKEVIQQINIITSTLIKFGLSVEENFPNANNGSIYIGGHKDISIALKKIPYKEIYDILEKDKNYNIKLLDGALLQFMYTFDQSNDLLLKHRLSFFPSPYLDKYQNNPDIYELDEIYADVIAKNIISTPIRFDYDPKNFILNDHPRSHLTIGQYENCRIPVKAPLTPYCFILFIIKNFYNTAFKKFSQNFNFSKSSQFANSIEKQEKEFIHIAFDT